MPKLDNAMRRDYINRWVKMVIRPEWSVAVSESVRRIARGTDRYKALAEQTRVPWYVIGLIHELESGCRFNTHLHNGDQLTQRTRNVPRNRPTKGKPPFTFEESALDALAYDGLAAWKDWTASGISYKLEGFNGFGYRNKGVPSPYLYSGSTWYTRGKYVADGVYDAKAVSKQVGVLVILKALANAGAFEIEVA